MYGMSRVRYVKVEPRSIFRSTRELPYNSSILFTWVRMQVKITRQWKSTLTFAVLSLFYKKRNAPMTLRVFWRPITSRLNWPIRSIILSADLIELISIWRWLSQRLSKGQSLSTATVLFRLLLYSLLLLMKWLLGSHLSQFWMESMGEN